MDLEAVRDFCLSLPATTEDIQWGDDLLFRVGGKIYAGIGLNPAARHRLSFKCEPETFAELVEREGVVRAAYTGRYHWVALRFDAVREEELKSLLTKSYELILGKLPKKQRDQLLERRKFKRGSRTALSRRPARPAGR